MLEVNNFKEYIINKENFDRLKMLSDLLIKSKFHLKKDSSLNDVEMETMDFGTFRYLRRRTKDTNVWPFNSGIFECESKIPLDVYQHIRKFLFKHPDVKEFCFDFNGCIQTQQTILALTNIISQMENLKQAKQTMFYHAFESLNNVQPIENWKLQKYQTLNDSYIKDLNDLWFKYNSI